MSGSAAVRRSGSSAGNEDGGKDQQDPEDAGEDFGVLVGTSSGVGYATAVGVAGTVQTAAPSGRGGRGG